MESKMFTAVRPRSSKKTKVKTVKVAAAQGYTIRYDGDVVLQSSILGK
jgi:hypothetical protein